MFNLRYFCCNDPFNDKHNATTVVKFLQCTVHMEKKYVRINVWYTCEQRVYMVGERFCTCEGHACPHRAHLGPPEQKIKPGLLLKKSGRYRNICYSFTGGGARVQHVRGGGRTPQGAAFALTRCTAESDTVPNTTPQLVRTRHGTQLDARRRGRIEGTMSSGVHTAFSGFRRTEYCRGGPP
jgi:hypothetical protein